MWRSFFRWKKQQKQKQTNDNQNKNNVNPKKEDPTALPRILLIPVLIICGSHTFLTNFYIFFYFFPQCIILFSYIHF